MVSTELVIKIIGKTSTYASITSVFANGKPVRMTFLGSVCMIAIRLLFVVTRARAQWQLHRKMPV